jgi:hypothetical protein
MPKSKKWINDKRSTPQSGSADEKNQDHSRARPVGPIHNIIDLGIRTKAARNPDPADFADRIAVAHS